MKLVKMFDIKEICGYMKSHGVKNPNILWEKGYLNEVEDDCAIRYWIEDYDYILKITEFYNNENNEILAKAIITLYNFFIDNGCEIGERVWIDATC